MTRTTPPTLPANPLEAIQLLRKVRDQLKESDASEIADAFATMLANYEATGGAEPLDRAFRLVPACGQEGWAARERRALRDAALVEVWHRFYAALKPTGAAKMIARDIARVSQISRIPPDSRSAALAEIYRLSAGSTLGQRQILSIFKRLRAECAVKGLISLRTFSLRNDATTLKRT